MTKTIMVCLLMTLASAPGCSEDAPAGPCDGITCSSRGRCVEQDGAAVCECDAGTVPDGLMCIDPTEPVPTTDQVVQHGIAWTFDTAVPFGRYANGDFWVVGPVTLLRIAPDQTGGHHGWEVNPADGADQGFDERIANYTPSAVPDLPYTAQPGQSIVKAVSWAPLSDDGCRPCLQTAAVLTVVAAPPPDLGETVFRPPYFGPDKPEYSTNDLNESLLPTVDATGEPPTLAHVADGFRRVQLDHKENWVGRHMHPVDNLPDYGSSIASRNAEGALRLMLADASPDKREALILYVQYGIDLYHMMRNGIRWPPNGGHCEGRKLPITFASVVLEATEMQAEVSAAATEVFGENGGTYHSDLAGTALYGQGWGSEDNYWTNLVFDTGSRTLSDPYQHIDGGHLPAGSYQYCCLSKPWKSTATALYLMPELLAVWNDDDFLTYVERWVTFGGWAQPDPCAPPFGVCVGGNNAGADCTSANQPDICTVAEGSEDEAHCDTTGSWDAHYGVSYGPDGAGGCIPDTNPSDGTGRFPWRHGLHADEGHYGSGFADVLWSVYVSPGL